MFEGMKTFTMQDLFPDASHHKNAIEQVLGLSSCNASSTSSPLNACHVHFTLSLNETSAPTIVRNHRKAIMDKYIIDGYNFMLPSNFHALEQCSTSLGCSHSFEVISKKNPSLEYDIFNIMIVSSNDKVVDLKREMDSEIASSSFKNITQSQDIQSCISNECLSDRGTIDKWTFTSREGSLQMLVLIASFRIDPRKSEKVCLVEYRKRMTNHSSDSSHLGYKIENLIIEIINSISINSN